jgi:hypothetical protein
MATNTTNLNLIKPDFNDVVDITDLNNNMDTIDSYVVAVQETDEKTAAYTLALGDVGKVVQMNASGAVNVTVPLNSAVAFPVGTIIGVYNRSANDVTIVEESGVTVRNKGTVIQFGEASLRKRGTNEWVMVGG